jgi:RHH-type proline utilization regulon transcriptional repressor/proline dehydrogenase/delta 1-pyrroline-5-carboxylate dehydrogenase
VGEIGELMRSLARQAAQAGIGLTVDAEECDRLGMSLDVIEHVARDQALSGWDGLGMAVQAYGKRARPVISWAEALARAAGRRISVRLVKGAYWDAEIKRCQVEGLSDYPVFTRKAATDVSYLACARDLLGSDYLFAAFATHNALTVATIQEWAGARRDFEFQRLHGMGDGLYDTMVQDLGYSCRIYAPVGGHKELLAYLVRRLLENGANTSFVNQLSVDDILDKELLADPAEQVAKGGCRSHAEIPLPRDIFPGRRNSSGVDLQDIECLRSLAEEVQMLRGVDAAPLVCGRIARARPRSITSPADRSRVVGSIEEAAPQDVAAAISEAAVFAQEWSETPVDQRAQSIERWAESLEREQVNLIALAVHEAGKTFADAVAEVREAVDFCRYYAHRARLDFCPEKMPGCTGEHNELRLVGRGVFACISPWNFPLAIFVGQVAAALVAGNTVIAKPAPQTPLIAFRAVQLAHQSGVPAKALQFLPGGAEVGRALVRDSRVAGVAFTGSTSAAKRIARDLLEEDGRPLVPLIAETGGINVMIVDSTALPEQVVADVVASAFRSAGQRCSALRLLALQEEVAAPMLEMLSGAMDTLVLGNPAEPATDIGPVIDEAARDRLETYRQARRDKWVHALPERGGLFVPPTIIALDEAEDLGAEWFGPILHVATWKADRLHEFVERINKVGFGLTMGLHSRIASVAGHLQRRARVGNLYVNRSMIGAVVGSQPFGGEGLSGTGPKAGGPLYLARFATERTVSVDTTSAGGNATLLSLAEIEV